MSEKPSCEQCRLTYAMYDEDPPCGTCVPPLESENVMIARIYNIIHAQIGINNAAVFDIIDRYVDDFHDQEYVFELLLSTRQSVKIYEDQKAQQSAPEQMPQMPMKRTRKPWRN